MITSMLRRFRGKCVDNATLSNEQFRTRTDHTTALAADGGGTADIAATTQYTMSSVTRDATSNIYCPASATEWTHVLGVTGLLGTVNVPIGIWLCQEASGNLADSGPNGLTLTASGSGLAYQLTISGWTRKAVRTTDNTSGRWDSTSATLPDLGSAAATLFGYVYRSGGAASAFRMALGMGTTTQTYIGGGQTTTRVAHGANAVGAGNTTTGVVRPYGILHDKGNSRVVGYDNDSKQSPTFSASVTGKGIRIGGLGGVVNPGTDYCLYAWLWDQAPSDANVKTILQKLGWTVAW